MLKNILSMFGSQKFIALAAGWVVVVAGKAKLSLSETEIVALLTTLVSFIGAKAWEDGKKLDNGAHPAQTPPATK